MQKAYSLAGALLAVMTVLVPCGCGKPGRTSSPRPASRSPGSISAFPWQNESQFIVTEIVSDLAEMTYYAKHKSLPSPQSFSVTAAEKPGSVFGAPVYLVEVVLDKIRAGPEGGVACERSHLVA